MAERTFNIETFQSHWDNLEKAQRCSGECEIVLSFAENAVHMGMATADGQLVGLPWRYEPTIEGARLLLQQLRSAGILMGELDEYLTDEDDMQEDVAKEELAREELAGEELAAEQLTENELDGEASTDDINQDEESQPAWQPYEPEPSTAKTVSMAVLKVAALVGGGYIAYRMARRPSVGPIRF